MEQVAPKRVILLVLAACLVGMIVGSTVTFAVMQRSYSIPASGMVIGINVDVFADSTCTQKLLNISWGSVYPGESASRILYVKNTGNALMALNLTTRDWNPVSANGPISITWDKEGVSLAPGQSTAATLTLSTSPSITGISDFSVNIVITGTG